MTWKSDLDVENNRIDLENNGVRCGHYNLLKEPLCIKCSNPLNESSLPRENGTCPSCSHMYGFERVYAVGPYYTTKYFFRQKELDAKWEELLSKHIILLKKHGWYTMPLSLALTSVVGERYKLLENVDVIIGVPGHSDRNIERGFDQVERLCDTLAKLIEHNFKISIPFENGAIRKTENISMVYEEYGKRKSRAQAERYALVKGLYVTEMDVDDKRVLLIDDVLTTGADVSECSYQLLEAGAESVNVTVLGRTIA